MLRLIYVKNPRFQIKSCTEFVKESIFLLGNIKVIDCTCLHHLRKNDICLHVFFYANNIVEYFFTFVVIKKVHIYIQFESLLENQIKI